MKRKISRQLRGVFDCKYQEPFRDQGRRNRKQTSFDDIDDFFEPIDDTMPSDPFMKKRIANAFGKLTDNCHEILTDTNGYKYSEIKELTGKPINTIKSSVFKCREKFSTHLYGSEQGTLENSNGDADDPSLEEISAFLDGETVTGLTSEKLDSLSESNPELYQKVAEMHSQLTLDNFLSSKNLTVTNEIKEKILSLVKDKVSLDDDELIDEDELLVSSYVDGEVSAEEAIEAEKLIAESDYYRSIYEAHSDAKNKVASLIKEKKTKSQLLPNGLLKDFCHSLQ